MKKRYYLPLFALFFLLTFPAFGQSDANVCQRGGAAVALELGNVQTKVGQGGMSVLPYGEDFGFEAPKGSGIRGLSCVLTFMGGKVDDTPRVAPYWELWPGPYPEGGARQDTTHCQTHDRVFALSKNDLQAYNRLGHLAPDLAAWPAHLGAPVHDGDGDPTNYNLAGGDRPELLGDRMAWWIMNDAAGRDLAEQPLGLEVHVTAFGYNIGGTIGSTTFFRYRFVNKGEQPIDDFFFGLSPETDLGDPYDNYLGSDSTHHFMYVYNADDFDGNEDVQNDAYYGERPPALALAYLPGPTETPETFAGLHSFVPRWYRQADQTSYNHLSGLWGDGRPVTTGKDGRDPNNPVTRFFYHGDPVTGTGWSAMTDQYAYIDDVLASTGPYNLAPGAAQEVWFALVWSRGEDHLDSVRKLRDDVGHLHRVAADILVPDLTLLDAPATPAPAPDLAVTRNYPNPFTDRTTIAYSLPQSMHVRLTVYDVLGREVATLVDARKETGTYEADFEAAGLPNGVYFYRIEMDHIAATHTMMRVR